MLRYTNLAPLQNTCHCLLMCTIFLYTLHKKTAEHKAELKVFSHSRLRVRCVLRARGVITFTAGQPHESYHRRESLGSWTHVDCTETRSRWVTHNCKSYNASPHTNFVLQATNMKGLGTRLVNIFITQAAEVEASASLSRSTREVILHWKVFAVFP